MFFILFYLLKVLLIIFIFLGRIAFITLLERKILGLTQIRVSPNKTFYKGLLQPVYDGLKLLSKQFIFLKKRNLKIGFFLSFIRLISLFLIIFSLPFYSIRFKIRFLFFITIVGLSIFFSLLLGFSSNSKYPYLRIVRSISQSISYEIRFSFLLFPIIFYIRTISFRFFFNIKTDYCLFIRLICVIILITFLAEINRSPFDFLERESELVSGFNTEFSRLRFVIIFLTEYGIIIFYRLVVLFIFSYYIFFLFLFSILLIRRVFPRFRYDKIILLNWFKILPFRTLFLFFIFI